MRNAKISLVLLKFFVTSDKQLRPEAAQIVTHCVFLVPACLTPHPGVSFAGAFTLAAERGSQLGKGRQ